MPGSGERIAMHVVQRRGIRLIGRSPITRPILAFVRFGSGITILQFVNAVRNPCFLSPGKIYGRERIVRLLRRHFPNLISLHCQLNHG